MHSSRSNGIPVWASVAIIVVAISFQQIAAHTIAESGAIRAAEGMGYTNVKVIDRHTFFPGLQGCSRSDMVMFDVTGTDPRGKKRSFIVCDGVFKASTVRFK